MVELFAAAQERGHLRDDISVRMLLTTWGAPVPFYASRIIEGEFTLDEVVEHSLVLLTPARLAGVLADELLELGHRLVGLVVDDLAQPHGVALAAEDAHEDRAADEQRGEQHDRRAPGAAGARAARASAAAGGGCAGVSGGRLGGSGWRCWTGVAGPAGAAPRG